MAEVVRDLDLMYRLQVTQAATRRPSTKTGKITGAVRETRTEPNRTGGRSQRGGLPTVVVMTTSTTSRSYPPLHVMRSAWLERLPALWIAYATALSTLAGCETVGEIDLPRFVPGAPDVPVLGFGLNRFDAAKPGTADWRGPENRLPGQPGSDHGPSHRGGSAVL